MTTSNFYVVDGETMNVNLTDNIKIITLAEVVRDGIAPTLDIEYTAARDGDAEHTHADISNATELIDYEPSRDIREGVSEFIEWYDQNRGWLNRSSSVRSHCLSTND